MWREGLGHCLYCFGSVHQHLGGPIRLQNASDVMRLNVTRFNRFSSSRYFTKTDSIVEKVHSCRKWPNEYQLACSWNRVGGSNA